MPNLVSALALDKMLRAQLLEAFPELGDDERALIDTLDGISDLDDQIAAVLRTAVEREAMAEGIEGLVFKLHARHARLLAGADKMREAALSVMLESGRRKITKPDMTVTVMPGKAGVTVTDETLLPDSCVKIVRRPSMTAIREAIEAGESVPGTAPKNPKPYLTVRLT